MSTETADTLREQVRQRYAAAAIAAGHGGCGCREDGSCCGNVTCDGEESSFGDALYDAEQRGELPQAAVLTEMARVLNPGGRIGVSDVVAEDHLTADERAQRGSYVGCIAGALSRSEYLAGLEAAGFEGVSVEFTHAVADGMHGAIVKASKTGGSALP